MTFGGSAQVGRGAGEGSRPLWHQRTATRLRHTPAPPARPLARVESGTVSVPVMVDGAEQFRMSYQHDLVVKQGEVVRLIGSVKTSSKDRLDKVFVDKFLYSKITGTSVPHVAVFLNDVQRKATPKPNQFGVSATFLPGHFKGFTIKLNPLDGVYYCDVRPNMREDPWLASRIRTIDCFFCDDLPRFVP